jgi:hypothetical protein
MDDSKFLFILLVMAGFLLLNLSEIKQFFDSLSV